jgi:hypothetical protein
MLVKERPVTLLEKLNLSPEEKMLLICARLQLSQGQREELAGLVAASLDWEQVLEKARWHGLTPLVYHHLRHGESGGNIPSSVMAEFKHLYLGNAAQNLDFEAELWRVVNYLQQSGIKVVLLKGAALLHTVYPNAELRPLSDLDVLVQQEHAHQAQSLVIGLGYHAVGSPIAQEDTEKNHRHLPGLLRNHRPILVEIHRHVVRKDSWTYFDIEDFWYRAKTQFFDKGNALVLAPEDLLIHLCINFITDRQFKSVGALRQLCDIAESIQHYQDVIDWRGLIAQVQKYRASGPVGCSLFLAQQLLEAPFPDYVLGELSPVGYKSREIALFVRQRMLGNQWVAKGLMRANEHFNPWSVPIGILRRVFPSKHYLAVHYDVPANSKRIYFLYLKRLGRSLSLAVRYARNPSSMAEDLEVDRWLHSMYTSGTNDKATSHK